MKPKLALCLVLVLSGVLSGCSTADVAPASRHATLKRSTKLSSADEPPAYVEEAQIFKLKDELWEAVRTKNADRFVDCYFVEERFNTPELRSANRNQVEKFLQGEIFDLNVMEFRKNELGEVMEIQNAKPDSLVRYSLVPQKILCIRRKTEGGWTGWRLLIGSKNGKWHIVTFAGRTT